MGTNISAQIEELDALVKDFSNRLGTYVGEMNEKTNEIGETIAVLGRFWSGSAYDSFRRKMLVETEKMGEALGRGENLKRELDEIALQFADALASLKESGE